MVFTEIISYTKRLAIAKKKNSKEPCLPFVPFLVTLFLLNLTAIFSLRCFFDLLMILLQSGSRIYNAAAAVPFRAIINSMTLSSSLHRFLLTTVSNWNLRRWIEICHRLWELLYADVICVTRLSNSWWKILCSVKFLRQLCTFFSKSFIRYCQLFDLWHFSIIGANIEFRYITGSRDLYSSSSSLSSNLYVPISIFRLLQSSSIKRLCSPVVVPVLGKISSDNSFYS